MGEARASALRARRGEVEAVDDDVARSPLREALHAPDGVVERAEPEGREQAAHLLGDEQR